MCHLFCKGSSKEEPRLYDVRPRSPRRLLRRLAGGVVGRLVHGLAGFPVAAMLGPRQMC